MNKLAIFAAGLALLSAAACNEKKSDTETDTVSIPATDNNLPVDPPATIEISGDTSQTVKLEPIAAPTAQTTAAGMNPPHGEPGHRCDIPVGAPLNSPPGPDAGAQVQMQQSPPPTNMSSPVFNAPSHPVQTSQPAASPATGTVAAGMNPPHGEPGHDCSIPVGAPLKK